MDYTGELRIYVGGKMELCQRGDVFEPVWIPGKVVAVKYRYTGKTERHKIIERARELWGNFEVVIFPDDESDNM